MTFGIGHNTRIGRMAEEFETIARSLHVEKHQLSAEAIIEWAAQNPDSVLHSSLDWDDSKAGHRYRLAQARGLIRRVSVVIQPRETKTQTVVIAKKYTSLSNERGSGGGYRTTVSVLSDAEKRHRLLLDTITRLCSIKEVSHFAELASVAREIGKVRDRFLSKKVA